MTSHFAPAQPVSAPAWRTRLDRVLSDPAWIRRAAGWPLARWLVRRRSEQLFGVMAGFVHAQVLLACVRLGLFEQLRGGPRSLDDLANACGVPAPRLDRLLQSARSLALLECRTGRGWALGPLGRPLATDAGLRRMVEHNALLYRDLQDPLALLRGEAASLQAYWPYAGGESAAPAQATDYSGLMAGSQHYLQQELLRSYDFRDHDRALDVGGGEGAWVGALAQAVPGLALSLFDLPAVAQVARARLARAGLGERVAVHGGSFLHDPLPEGADLITLLRVAHDHPDTVVRRLLAAAWRALPVGGTLLLAEPMADADGASAGDPYYHFYLMAMGEGRLRTPAELMALMHEAGFRHLEAVPNAHPLHGRILLGRRTRAGQPGAAS